MYWTIMRSPILATNHTKLTDHTRIARGIMCREAEDGQELN